MSAATWAQPPPTSSSACCIPTAAASTAGPARAAPITLGTTDAVHQASTNLPITARDFIGLGVPNNLTFDLATTTGATEPIFVPPLADGGSATSPTYNIQDTELLINADVACPGETLSVTKTGTGDGTVTSADGGIQCGATCSRTYPSGTAVTLLAHPAAGSTFAGWSGACSATTLCTLTLSSSLSVTAVFNRIPLPGTKITSAKTSSKHGTATFKFIAIGQASGFQCALVKAPKRHHDAPKPSFASCRSPKRYTRLQLASYTFLVRAFNAAGADPTPARKKFTI